MLAAEALLEWASTNGVRWEGIQAVSIPGRGIGVTATRQIEPGEVVLTVPTRVMRSIDSVPQTIRSKLPSQWSIHSLLALDLVLNAPPDPWHAVLPTLEDFRSSVPLLWPTELAALLPPPALSTVTKQRAKVRAQWDVIRKAFRSVAYEHYMEAWLVLNTRTFYHSTPETEQYDWEERLSLLPVADLLNHADRGCQVLYSDQEYTIVADRVYHVGEEVSNSYGEHSNDFLLAEYGFILEQNSWDEVCIDDAILPQLSELQEVKLGEMDLISNFRLRQGRGACDRTKRLMQFICSTQGLAKDTNDGFDEGQSIVREDELLSEFLRSYVDKIGNVISGLETLQSGEQSQRELLSKRWRQIETLVRQFIQQS